MFQLTSIKGKFIAVQLTILLVAFCTFLFLASRTFLKDKTLFIRDLNLALLDGTSEVIVAELKDRLEAINKLLPSLVLDEKPPEAADQIFSQMPVGLSKEIYQISMYRQTKDDQVLPLRSYQNHALLSKKGIDAQLSSQINSRHPLHPGAFNSRNNFQLQNRSIEIKAESRAEVVPVLTLIVSADPSSGQSERTVVAIDLDQDFLIKILRRSDAAELYLLTADGRLITHPNLEVLNKYADQDTYAHELLSKLHSKEYLNESLEVTIDGENYVCGIRETGVSGMMIVSQIKTRQAFAAVKTLLGETLLSGTVIIWLGIFFSVVFAGRLTRNIRILRDVAENIGSGNLDPRFEISSSDELRSVAESLEWMTHRIKDLLLQTREKARMAEELKTAGLLQNTLLKTQTLTSPNFELISHYTPATECSGDFFDTRLKGNKLTIAVADATGHGAAAAIATAVAKSSLETVSCLYENESLTLTQIMSTINQVIYASCKGELLVTMCLIEVDFGDGTITICNAGHESPYCWRYDEASDEEKRAKPKNVETLLTRGERLGFDPKTTYQTQTFHLNIDDVLLIYTDGLSEGRNADGKEWGERALRKALSTASATSKSVSEVQTKLLADFHDFTGAAPQADDVTFVLFRRIKKEEARAKRAA